MKVVIIPMLRPGEEPVLAGRLTGKRAFLRALEQLPTLDEPTIVALDFGGVELATASFLSEAVLPLRDHLRLRGVPGYPVVANLAENVLEEFEYLLHRTGDAVLLCSLLPGGEIKEAQIIGALEPKLKDTFTRVSKKGQATAGELYTESQATEAVGPTAWNNRLAALAEKSLLVEILQGRSKKYRPVLEVP